MTGALPPLGAEPRLQGEPSGLPDDGERRSDAFAEILAARLTSHPSRAALLPEVVPDHGPAIVAIPVEWSGEIAAPDSQPVAVHADRFNEHGFFGRPDAPGNVGRLAGSPTPIEPARPATAPFETDLPAGSDAVGTPVALVSMVELFPAASAASMPIPSAALPRPKTATAVMLSTPARVAEETVQAKKAVRERSPLRDASVARAPVEVALSELAQGLHVAARLGALAPAERQRLRDEIAALLSRHGLSARAIAIAAPVAGTSRQEGSE